MKISLFPTLKNYKKEYFGKDLTAGIMIAAVSIPISMGYAEVSGLPAVFGLYGSVLPILFFESGQARYIYFNSGYGRFYQRNRIDNYLDADSKDYGR